MTNLLDDYFNVHNTFQLVVNRTGPSSLLLGDYQLFGGDNTLYGTQQTLSRVQSGESISFFPINTFSWPPTATGIVSSIELVDDPTATQTLASARSAAATKAKQTPCQACSAGFHSYSTAQLYHVTFNAPLDSSVLPLTLANADNISNTGALIEDCTFIGSTCNMARFKSSGGTIRGSTWGRGPTMHNFEIAPLQNWDEGMLGLHDIVIANNTFFGMSSSPVHAFGAVDVTQVNNTFHP